MGSETHLVVISKIAGLVLLFAAAAKAWTDTGEFEIKLVVIGANPNVGAVMASLFDSSESYMRNPLVEATVSVDAKGTALINFGSHRPGQYAIAVIYDQNENGKLDTGFLGIPKEKIGFSNDAKGKFGPAKWADTHFSLENSDLQVAIHLARAGQN